MTYKLKLNQVREVLGMEIKLEIVKLMDGTAVEVEKFEVGYPAFIVAEDGSKTPAPSGEHTLEDGTVIMIDENGLIAEISTKEEEAADEEIAAEPVIEVSGAKKMEEMPIEEPKVSVAMAEIATVKEACAALFAAIEEVAKEVEVVKEEMSAMKGKMEKFSKAPAANPIPKVTMANVVDAIDAIDAKAEFLKSIAKK
jgi:hypothetical protein